MKRFALCTLLLIACNPSTDSTTTTSPDAFVCNGPLGAPIPSSALQGMTACCQANAGAAHCLDASKVPSQIQSVLDTCDSGGYCVPDNFLETGGSQPPQSSTQRPT